MLYSQLIALIKSEAIYFSKKDTRWIVPKRNPALGWTFNLGNTKGAWAMLLTLLVPILIFSGVLVFVAVKTGH